MARAAATRSSSGMAVLWLWRDTRPCGTDHGDASGAGRTGPAAVCFRGHLALPSSPVGPVAP